MEKNGEHELVLSVNTPAAQVFQLIVNKMGLGGQNVRLEYQVSLPRQGKQPLDNVSNMEAGLVRLADANRRALAVQPTMKVTNKVSSFLLSNFLFHFLIDCPSESG